MRIEDRIRDCLSQRLDIVEEGLRLVHTEYPLPNPLGAGGFIDILARDKTGLLVVIEIKRSDKTAREAIHELHKYVTLLKTGEGLDDAQLRCVLVSTSWHELLVPFSSFARTAGYPVEGYSLELDVHERPNKTILVNLAPEAKPRKLCPHYMVYLYDECDGRSRGSLELRKALSDVGVRDYCIVEMSSGANIPYPFALYVAMDSVDAQVKPEIEQRGLPYIEDFQEHDEWAFEQAALTKVSMALVGRCDSMEVGCPEKFARDIQTWNVEAVHRGGRVASLGRISTDEDLVRELAGFEGNHASVYTALATPKHKAAWKSASRKSRYSLMGNHHWQRGLDWFLSQVESEMEDATVAVSIYNPGNVLFSLYFYASRHDTSYLPRLEIVVDGPQGESAVLTGFVEWDGKTFPSDPERTLGTSFNDKYVYFTAVFFKDQWQHDNDLMANHGFRYTLVETRARGQEEPRHRRLVLENDRWHTEPLDVASISGTQEFVEANYGYVDHLQRFIRDHTHGL